MNRQPLRIGLLVAALLFTSGPASFALPDRISSGESRASPGVSSSSAAGRAWTEEILLLRAFAETAELLRDQRVQSARAWHRFLLASAHQLPLIVSVTLRGSP